MSKCESCTHAIHGSYEDQVRYWHKVLKESPDTLIVVPPDMTEYHRGWVDGAKAIMNFIAETKATQKEEK